MRNINIGVNLENIVGVSWFAAWLFTIGYAKLGFWHGAFALVIWPYYIGAKL